MQKRVFANLEEFKRKMELERYVKIVIDKNGSNEKGLDYDMKDALKTYKLHGKIMDMKDIEWRGWKMYLRQYLDTACDRKVVWVVGKEGNEGKSFFEVNIKEKFGYSRVCKLELSENS